MLLRCVAAGGRAAASASLCPVSTWRGREGRGGGGRGAGAARTGEIPASPYPRDRAAARAAGGQGSLGRGPSCCSCWARSLSARRAALLLGRAPGLGQRVLARPPARPYLGAPAACAPLGEAAVNRELMVLAGAGDIVRAESVGSPCPGETWSGEGARGWRRQVSRAARASPATETKQDDG